MTQEEFKKKAMLKPKKKTIMGLPVTPEIVTEINTRNVNQSSYQKPQVINTPPVPSPITGRATKATKLATIPSF